jgi:glucans biosynthesis protein
VDNGPKSFGLYQTSRDYENFQDTEARYHDRPSARVEPQDDWGAGAVMLVEIPTGDEFLDNIVTFWRPLDALQAGSEHRFSYRLTWTLTAPDIGGLAQILQSRSGREHDREGYRRFVIDVATSHEDTIPVISGPDGADITGVSVFPLPDGSGTRVTFLMGPGALDAADIRLSLRGPDATPLSPVWIYRWTRARDGGV